MKLSWDFSNQPLNPAETAATIDAERQKRAVMRILTTRLAARLRERKNSHHDAHTERSLEIGPSVVCVVVGL